VRWVRQHLMLEVEESALQANPQALSSSFNLEYCYTFPSLVLRN
jgi:hypothetical protein